MLSAWLRPDVAEGEERSPQDEGEQGNGKKRIEAGKDRLKQQREPRPAHHDCQDQPYIVGFPHRRHGVVDELASPVRPGAAAGEKVPDAGAIVDAAGDAVGRDGEQQNERREACEGSRHGDGPIRLADPSEASSGRGPYGAPSSGARTSSRSSSWRHRAASPSNTLTKMSAIKTYTTSSTDSMIQTNDAGADVTASPTRIKL